MTRIGRITGRWIDEADDGGSGGCIYTCFGWAVYSFCTIVIVLHMHFFLRWDKAFIWWERLFGLLLYEEVSLPFGAIRGCLGIEEVRV